MMAASAVGVAVARAAGVSAKALIAGRIGAGKSESELRICLVSTHFAEYGFSLSEALSGRAEVLLVASAENAP